MRHIPRSRSTPPILKAARTPVPQPQYQNKCWRLAGQGPHPQRAAGLLEDVDGLQVAAAAQAQHRVHRQLRKVVLVVRQDLAAQRGARDVQQVLPQPHTPRCRGLGNPKN